LYRPISSPLFQDRLDALVKEVEASGGTALALPSDIADQTQAKAAVQTVIDRFGRLDILINNAGLMLIGPIVAAEVEEWEQMLAVNVLGLLYITHAALPHLLTAAADGPRNVSDVVNISSIAGRRASALFGVYNLTKFGVNGFTESLRQEVTRRHVRVGVLEPGAVDTELGSHNNDRMQTEMLEPFNAQHQRLEAEDIADGIEFMVTRPRHASIGELLVMPTDQVA
jgi:NADP-dependent 3-hydroxy acid dehydrogenase YdfG